MQKSFGSFKSENGASEMFKNFLLASDKLISSFGFMCAEVNGQRAELLRIKSEYVSL